jgi:hypothetical protein
MKMLQNALKQVMKVLKKNKKVLVMLAALLAVAVFLPFIPVGPAKIVTESKPVRVVTQSEPVKTVRKQLLKGKDFVVGKVSELVPFSDEDVEQENFEAKIFA